MKNKKRGREREKERERKKERERERERKKERERERGYGLEVSNGNFKKYTKPAGPQTHNQTSTHSHTITRKYEKPTHSRTRNAQAHTQTSTNKHRQQKNITHRLFDLPRQGAPYGCWR